MKILITGGGGFLGFKLAKTLLARGKLGGKAITGITLLGGFASTVGWPLTAALEHALGWRGACAAWAALHLVVGLPLNAALPRAPRLNVDDATPARAAHEAHVAAPPPAPAPSPAAPAAPTVLLLSWVFAATLFVSTAVAAHLPRLLGAIGATPAAAIALAGAVMPAAPRRSTPVRCKKIRRPACMILSSSGHVSG